MAQKSASRPKNPQMAQLRIHARSNLIRQCKRLVDHKPVFSYLVLVFCLCQTQVSTADTDLPTKFNNTTTVGNTRHNMTQRQTAGGGPSGVIMDAYRNDYAEVCVYCHTPHVANTTTTAPLWNRTMKETTYTTYSSSTLTGTVSQPGPASLTCLSCHDGQTAVDSIINMPGSGKYSAAQQTSQNNTFLNDSWTNPSGLDATVHVGLNPTISLGCLSCHSTGAGLVGSGATDFTVFAIGTDLNNDHPVGVKLPTGDDWNVPGGTQGTSKYFDRTANGRMDKNEIRFYDSGDGNEVECASCHDPHGVPSGGAGSTFNPTFLRINNTGSAVCLTCHNK